MQLIGAGLPRTATMSQKVALDTLGLPCYHMYNVLADLSKADLWRQVLDGEVPAGDAMDGCAATVDWPGSYYYKDLIEAYPDAKVLLSVRSPESWAQSMHDTIWGLFY
ncbi:MAG: sulfotransferase family protein, partial [Solirubrobacteraceae bacterium]